MLSAAAIADAAARAAADAAATPSAPPQPSDTAAAAHGCFFLSLLLLSVLAARLLHVTRFRWATEGSAALLLGVVCTGALSLLERRPSSSSSSQLLPLAQLASLTSPLLFNVLLPPVVFFAGFSAKKKHLFSNAATIAALGAAGTWVAAAAIAVGIAPVLRSLGLATGRPLLQTALALGAIAASSDTVAVLRAVDPLRHPNLHAMAFGEGITNDAVAIVLLSAVSSPLSPAIGGAGKSGGSGKKWDDPASWPGLAAGLLGRCAWLMVASAAFGAAFGLGSALLVRWAFLRPRLDAEAAAAFAIENEDDDDNNSAVRAAARSSSSSSSSSVDQEVLVVALVGILSYLAADALSLSGVLSVFACGAVSSHYTWHSLAPAAQSLCLHGFRVVAQFCEMAMFVLAGVDAWATLLAPSSSSGAAPGAGGGFSAGLVRGRHGDGREGGSKAALQAGVLASALLALILATRVLVVLPTAAAANTFWRVARAQRRERQRQQRRGEESAAAPPPPRIEEEEQEEEEEEEAIEEEAQEGGVAAAAPLLPRRRADNNKRSPTPAAAAAAAAAALAPPLALSVADTLVLYLAGLPRGAVTLALAYHHFDGGARVTRGGGDGGSAGGGALGRGLFSSSPSSPSASSLARDDHVITVAVMGVVFLSTVALGALAGPAIAWLLREEDKGEPSRAWLRRSVGSRTVRAYGERPPPPSATVPAASAQLQFLSGAGSLVDVGQLEALLRAARSGLLTRPPAEVVVGVVEPGAAAAAGPPPAVAAPARRGGGEVIGLHARWRAFDAAWMQPVFGGREEAAARGAVAMSFEAFD
jgi:NhaP-type Na+/H+ or K+/H+ antiporter